MTQIAAFRQAVKYWWLYLLIGILLVVFSISIIMSPLEGLLGLTIFLGLSSLLTGIGQIIFSNKNKDSFQGWKLSVGGGILEIITGLILLFYPQISLAILPAFISLWLLFRGFTMISMSSNMKKIGFKKTNWVLIGGILSLLFAIFIFFNPLAASIGVMIWIGLSILFAGIAAILIAFGIREINEEINDNDDD